MLYRSKARWSMATALIKKSEIGFSESQRVKASVAMASLNPTKSKDGTSNMRHQSGLEGKVGDGEENKSTL